jgi:hypothetical protein
MKKQTHIMQVVKKFLSGGGVKYFMPGDVCLVEQTSVSILGDVWMHKYVVKNLTRKGLKRKFHDEEDFAHRFSPIGTDVEVPSNFKLEFEVEMLNTMGYRNG